MTNQIILPSSVTQNQAHARVSDRYEFINTGAVIEKLQESGLVVRQATQARSKMYDGFQRHIVRMSMPNVKVSDTVPEIVIIGSHNGTSTHQFRLGLYRLVCSNGLISGSDIDSVKVRHFGGNVKQIVEDALDDLHTQLPLVAESIEMMRGLNMTDEQMASFAKQALELRGVPEKAKLQPNGAAALELNILRARRSDDVGNDLWKVFNRTQENIIQGMSGLRKISSPVRDVEINKGLWDIAGEFLKAA